MELYRRAAAGRLSELLGEATIAVDRRFLTLNLRHAAELEWSRTPADIRQSFERYAEGVNAAMSVGWSRRPIEYQLLRLTPEPWTPVDSLSIGKLFAWRLGENRMGELLRYDLMGELGGRVAELLPGPPEWAPTILEPVGSKFSVLGSQFSVLGSRFANAGASSGAVPREIATSPIAQSPNDLPGLEWLSADAHAMSNSWVVHGSRTATGRPLLANDPHLVLEMPSVWWEMHVVSDTLNVAGVTIPGIPFVIIGHNARVAWGLTNVGADVQDYFVEQLDPSRGHYRSGDGWLPLASRRHRIRVRGRSAPIEVEVRSTPRGPVLSAEGWRDVAPGEALPDATPGETALAFKWDAILLGESAAAFDALARARGWDDFLAGVRRFAAPAQNFVYADVDGNIGYAMSGLLPVRSRSDGSLPLPASSGDVDWRGSIDLGRLPAVLNPPSGQIVTANNEVDRSFPSPMTRDWVAPFRARRILSLLGDARNLDMRAMEGIQADITSLSADWILDHVEIPDEVRELREWDRRVDDRPVSALYEAFEEALWRRTFADEMPSPLYDRFYRYAGNERFAGLRAIVSDGNSPWFDDRTTLDRIEKRADIARAAGADAVGALRARFGDAAGWRWSEIHAITFRHSLAGGGRVLDWFFSRGPVPLVGNGTTVSKTTTNLRRPYETSEGASYRQILDIGNWDASMAVNTTGQSGHPSSPHYFDQNALWRDGRYHPQPFSEQAVEAATTYRLELLP